MRRTFFARPALILLILLAALTVSAQDTGIQPRLLVYLPEATEATANIVSLTERVNGDLLRRLNDRNRFDLTLREAPEDLEAFMSSLSEDPPEGADVLVAGVLDQRRDGSYRFLFDVWSAKLNRVFFSQEFDARGLPTMGDEQAITLLSRQVQEQVEEAVLELFPGFGWLVFDNQGAEASYEVIINDTSLGVNVQEISLLPGSWRIEILQEIDERVYVMARDEVELAPEDYYRLVFELSATPPEIPAYQKLRRTRDDWGVGIEFELNYLFPTSSVARNLFDNGSAILARFVANDVPFRSMILGVETGLGSFEPLPGGTTDPDFAFIPLLGFLGYRMGPYEGVDFTVKVGGGAQLAQVWYDLDPAIYGGSETIEDDEIIPTIRAAAELGYNWGRNIRIYIGGNFWSFLEEDGSINFVGLHGGLGIKF